MTTIALVGCCKPKLETAAPARDLYLSPLFKLSLAHALRHCQHVYIISAHYELVELDTVIEPYDRVLYDLGKERIKVWGNRVWGSVTHKHPKPPRAIHFYAGAEYVKPIRYAAHRYPQVDSFHEPLAGKTMGARLSWLKSEAA